MIAKLVRLVIWGLSSVVVLGTLLCAQPVRPAKGCSNATVHGKYGFVINGTINGNPITTVGQMVTNGSGNIAGMETVSNNGTISNDLQILGNYTINADCTGAAAITPQGGTKSNFDLVVISGGAEIDLVETDDGTVESGNAKAQGPKACSTSALKGPYGLQGAGTEVGVGPLVLGGQIVPHGDGTLDGTETILYVFNCSPDGQSPETPSNAGREAASRVPAWPHKSAPPAELSRPPARPPGCERSDRAVASPHVRQSLP